MPLGTTFTGPRMRALACTAVLAAALAGCGGSGQKPAALGPSTTVPATADTTTSAPTSAPATTAPATGTGDYAAFPGFTPPPSMVDTFDATAATGDPVKDKILADNVQVLRAMDVWSSTGSFDSPGVSTYISAAVHAAYQAQMAQYHASGKVPGGLARFYDRKVVAHDAKSGRVIVCEDGRQGYDQDAKTGKQIPDSSDGIVAITITVLKDSSGVWQAVLFNKAKNPALCTAP